MKFQPKIWLLVVFTQEHTVKEFKKYFDYKDDYFKTNKHTSPVAVCFQIDDPNKGVVCWYKCNKLCFSDDESSQYKEINLDMLLSEFAFYEGSYLSFKNLNKKSAPEILKIFKDISLPGVKVFYFGECDNKIQCVCKQCNKCPIFNKLVNKDLFFGKTAMANMKV